MTLPKETIQPTVEAMNEVIARFMGYYFNAGKFYSNGGGRGAWFKEAKYHESWDWLMPVVKKIKSIHFDILRQRANIMDYMRAAAPMNSALISIDLVGLHKGVYEFLTWYNKQKNDGE